MFTVVHPYPRKLGGEYVIRYLSSRKIHVIPKTHIAQMAEGASAMKYVISSCCVAFFGLTHPFTHSHNRDRTYVCRYRRTSSGASEYDLLF
jgi:hypothetical protein